MAGYVGYLERIYDKRTFGRKLAYLEHNFRSLFTAGQQVLEIGPGLGEFVTFASARGVAALDIIDRDESVLRLLKSRFAVRNAWLASAESLEPIEPLLPACDRIFLMHVLEHVEVAALAPLLGLLFRHLAPGGKLVATVPNGANPLAVVERYSDITHRSLFSPSALVQLVHMAGLPEPFEVEVQGFRIPPRPPINWPRIVAQQILHLVLLGVMVANGGVFGRLYHPNISMILTKKGR